MGTEGKLIGIAIREKPRAPMQEQTRAVVTVDTGLACDWRGKTNGRQVTVLARTAWDAACEEVGSTLPWTVRRANLFVDDVELPCRVGARLRVGEVVLEVAGETEPCGRMEWQCQGLLKALTPDWRGGVCCNVIAGGELEIGSPVLIETAEPITE